MKYFGNIAYATTSETKPGLWKETVSVREYYGDVLRNTRRREGSDKINDDISVNVQISIVADPFALEHFFAMRYIEWMGNKWKISEVEPQFPRLVLTLGGLYYETDSTGSTGSTGETGATGDTGSTGDTGTTDGQG